MTKPKTISLDKCIIIILCEQDLSNPKTLGYVEEVADELYKHYCDGSNPWRWGDVCVRVALKDEPSLYGEDRLGGCSYESEQDFINANDYYPDMVNAAKLDLEKKIQRIIEALD